MSLPGPLDLEHHELAYHFPQLDTDNLGIHDRASAELSAKMFASAPAELFVYPDLDLDGDLARRRQAATTSRRRTSRCS